MFQDARRWATRCSLLLIASACSGDIEPAEEMGGGGSWNGSGGINSPGGSPPGGTSASGGSLSGTGGAPSSGGTLVGSGGAAPATGGAVGAGGTVGTGGSGGTPDPGDGGSGGTPAGSLPPVTSVDDNGPYAVTIDENGGENSWVFRPTELGKDGVKHPIFIWGTGATSRPSQYRDHFTRVASHGFVVVSPNSPSVNATLLKASLDWILAQDENASGVYHQKLQTDRVAMGGHSLGSVGTFNVEATETRLTTTIHIAGGSFDGMGSSKVRTPTAYICGASGDIALPQCRVDFENVGSQPTFYSELQGIGHVEAARAALPGIVAWLRWHLAGEVERKAMFTGPSGQFFTGIWKSQTKNW